MRILLILAIFVVTMMLTLEDACAEPNQQEPKLDEVGIYFAGVKMPLNRILLIHKESSYCALKFIRAWVEMDEERLRKYTDSIRQGGVTAESAKKASEKKYALYESYLNKDGVLDGISGGILRREGTVSLLPLRGPFRPFVYQPGNGCVECGGIKLLWSYKTGVSFIPLGKSSDERDYGVELAPTPWTRIEEVNAKDLRIRWYRYDAKRETTYIPVGELWKSNR